MKKKDALVKTNPMALETKKAGSGLENAAAESLRQAKQKILVDATANIMKQLEESKISLEWCGRVIAFLEDKLAALRNGRWHYNNLHNTIIFDRADLNQTQPEKYRPENIRGLGGRA